MTSKIYSKRGAWSLQEKKFVKALEKTISNKTVTYDFHRLMDGAKLLKCSEFATAIVENL